MSTIQAEAVQGLNQPSLQRRVNALRKLDNITNWFYLLREYLILASIIGLTLCFLWQRESWGLAWAWNVPVVMIAIGLVGAGQHRLITLAHEASHYMLFRNRKLNELASDWFCMFPILSSTHHYRLQHLAHHQYVNDPERDPDVRQMLDSGHRFQFPMTPAAFLWHCVLKQILWAPKLIRYARARAQISSMGVGLGVGPYAIKRPPAAQVYRVGKIYLLALVGTLLYLEHLGNLWLLALVPPAMLACIATFYLLLKDERYMDCAVKPDIPSRWLAVLRLTNITIVFTTLAWLSYLTNHPWGLYYVMFWLVPLFTSFSFFMLLRQIVQHGNADQSRLLNTRIFLVSRLIQLAVFPLGMDYHLPHHLFPMVPHYRLGELHRLLMEVPDYRDHAVVVEGYFLHHHPAEGPTVLELMSQPHS
ncbi:MAG: fatty acid desaturase [Gemmataceae bacterium]